MTKEQLKEEAKKEFNMFSVYYRSVFSRDCSREETEEEKSTEMIERQNGLNLLLSQIDKAYEEGRKEMKSEIMKIELCPDKKTITQISELENKIQAFGYGQGWTLRKIESN